MGEGRASFSMITENNIYTVSELSQFLKNIITSSFGVVKVKGEVSGLTSSSSGHLYFSLKDGESLLKVVCWRRTTESAKLKDGLEVICLGYLSIYRERSTYQLVAQEIVVQGLGEIMLLLEERRKLLADEGLFAAERKKKLPFCPNTIGIITSRKGAVIHDMLHRIRDRMPVNVLLHDVPVQGTEAVPQIIEAIARFHKLPAGVPIPEVLIIARGGGSFEDLLPFSDERLVRTVAYGCSIPVVSAIGHETDVSLLDYVADLRAPTPTAAIELIMPVKAELEYKIAQCYSRVVGNIQASIKERRTRLHNCGQILDSKLQNMRYAAEKRLAETCRLLEKLLLRDLEKQRYRLFNINHKLFPGIIALEERYNQLSALWSSIQQRIGAVIDEKLRQLHHISAALSLCDYRQILGRGFAMLMKNGKLVTSGKQLKNGDVLAVELRDGVVEAIVTGIRSSSSGQHVPVVESVRSQPELPF